MESVVWLNGSVLCLAPVALQVVVDLLVHRCV
jgi:hypothetical protein